MKKTVYIKLKKHDKLLPTPHTVYVVESLRNAAQIWADSKPFRVGDYVTPEQADTLCDAQFYEVTISA